MSGRDYAYLDLAALPAVGSALLSPRPSLLFSADGSRILFANAAGAAFFGERHIDALFERRFASSLPATEQIARAARNLAPGVTRLERIRFAVGAGLASIAAECTRVVLPDGGRAVLVRLPATRNHGGPAEAARLLVNQLAAEDCLVAVLDAGGAILAESGLFDLLAAGEAAIEDLVAALRRSGDRLVKRAIRIGDERRPAGLAAIDAEQGLVHLLVVGPAERIVVEPDDRPALPPAAAGPSAGADSITAAEADAPEPAAAEPETAGAAEAGTGISAPPIVEPEVAAPEPQESVAAELQAEESHVRDADAAMPDAGTPAAAEGPDGASCETPETAPAHDTAQDGPDEGFRFVAPSGPVRFVFQMDAEGRFTFVSPEFAERVGPEAAIAVGESWGEMAARLGLDPTGAVAGLIARRDTWSGVSLDWPVEGGDHAVAVDLAALPAFSRERLFEGYRGFGVIRPLERHEAPPPSQRLVAPPRLRPPVTPPRPPVQDAQPAAIPLAGSNVIRLARPSPDGERLSPPEQDAFRRIAAALGAPASGASPPSAPPPTAEPPSPAPEPPPAAVEPPVAAVPELPAELPPGPSVEDVPFSPPVTVETEPEPAEPVAIEAPALPAEAPDAPFAAETVSAVAAEPELTVVEGFSPEAAAAVEPPPAGEAGAAEVAPALVPVPSDRLVEASLAAARQRIVELEAILDTATDGVIVVDENARIERLNRSAEALFGVDEAAVAGLRLPDLLAEESRQSALDYLDGLARNGVASVLNDGREVIGRVPQGGLIPLFMTMGRLPETGKFCAVLRDITQWKNAEGELVNAKRAAESASMQKSDFLAKVSHEIRTPLNAIIGFSEVMMEERFGPIGTERYKEYLRDIHISGAHLMSLLNDLLDLSKIEAGKLDLSFESVALNEIVMECVALMQPQANRERIIIRTSLSGQVPNIVADPRSIRQIVLNLVSNAVKFTLAGGQVIVSTAMEPHGEVTLRIRDTGIGMSEKDIETALKPFRQLSSSRERRSDGTGLGLPLTKALVEANRAAFVIDSTVGQGTLIRITFPATRVLAG